MNSPNRTIYLARIKSLDQTGIDDQESVEDQYFSSAISRDEFVKGWIAEFTANTNMYSHPNPIGVLASFYASESCLWQYSIQIQDIPVLN